MLKRLLTVVFVSVCVCGVPALASAAVLDYMNVNQFHFSPNGDGTSDTLQVNFKLLEAADVLLLVLATDSVTVIDTLAQLVNVTAAVEQTIDWDGRDGGGSVVADDTFLVYIEAMGGTGTDIAYERVFVDVTPPVVVLTNVTPYLFAPSSPDSLQSDVVTIQYDVSDPPPSSQVRLRVTIRDAVKQVFLIQAGRVTANGSFENTWDGSVDVGFLEDEVYEVRITVTDDAGNVGMDFSYINVDDEVPVITITSPPANQTVQSVTDSLLVGWAYDRNGIDTLEVRYDPAHPYLPITNTTVRMDTVFFNVPLADSTILEKSYLLGFRAVDQVGFRAVLPFEIRVDRTAPAPPVLSSAAGDTRNPLYTLTGSKQSDYARVRIYRNGTFIDSVAGLPSENTFSYDVTLIPGENRFTATGVDLAGNESGLSNTLSVVYTSSAGLFIRQPFAVNDAFQINLDKPARSIRLRIYDLAGHLVAVLEQATVSRNISIQWNGRNGDFEEVNRGPLVAVAEIQYTDDDREVMREVFLYKP